MLLLRASIILLVYISLLSMIIAADKASGGQVHGKMTGESTERESPISLNISCQRLGSAVACSFDFINNNDKQDYYLLKRNTPLEGLLSPFLSVFHKGSPLLYQGIHIHRNPPGRDEFVLLRSGESVSASTGISDVFEFQSDGLYTVTYDNPLHYVTRESMELKSSEFQLIQSQVSKSILLYLEGANSLSRPIKEDERGGKRIDLVTVDGCGTAGFHGGSKNQRIDVARAHSNLCKHFRVANGKIQDTPLYRMWFGSFTASRAEHVTEVLLSCIKGLEGGAVTYHINPSMCHFNWNAFTYTDSKSVSLCPAYHSYKVDCNKQGSATKEGILAHEWTHAFGHTKDYVYGEKRAKKLARRNPGKAIMNADNYEYFYCISQYI